VLYAAAATIAKGSFQVAAGRTSNDVSAWTSVTPSASDVPAAGRVTANVTIAVPRDAAPGERYGVVWAEVRSAPGSGGGVIQVNRVGIRLYLSVGPGGGPAADFTIDSLTAKRSPDGRPTVLASVHNTGGRALDMNGNLRLLTGPGGLSAGPFPATLGVTLAIADTGTVTVVLDRALPAGPWDARITLRSGPLERSARGTITFPDAGASPPVNTEAAASGENASDRPGWLHPAIAGLVILLLGIAALLFVLWRRRRRPDDDLVPDETRGSLTP
ncbi:MAG: peptidase, partial [Chloroflexota bacterium]|nr:peptidase [Chloroflexota bacterium]